MECMNPSRCGISAYIHASPKGTYGMNGVFQRAHGMSGDVWDAYLWALFLGQEVDAFIVPYMGIMHPVFLQASVHALLIYATSGAELDAFIVPYKGYPHLACCSGRVPFRAQNSTVGDLVCLGTYHAHHYA